MPFQSTLPQRFWSKVWASDGEWGCWFWEGSVNAGGYGQAIIRGKRLPAHRLVYEDFKGRMPARLETDHLCRQPSCVKPTHLEAVTCKTNMERKKWSAQRRLARIDWLQEQVLAGFKNEHSLEPQLT